ncbi:hypothetical protein FACS1894216_01240 [Synergistales bacterium]|nr:hypothetical protein FACS1894216_01240 [Synergistales bacterium]
MLYNNIYIPSRSVGDEDHWISTETGSHILLGEGGEIKAGMGGKFNGQKIGEVVKTWKVDSEGKALNTAHEKKAVSVKPHGTITEKQEGFIKSLLNKKAFTHEDADNLVFEMELKTGKTKGFDVDIDNVGSMSSYTASKLIDALLKAPSKEYAAAKEKKKEAAMDKYSKMIQWAKNNGVKGVKNMMKAKNIRQKIIEAGLDIPNEFL